MADVNAAKRLPLDLASLVAPAHTITIGGIVYAWETTDPAWTGEWAFPPKGWDDTSREVWIGTQGHLIAVTRNHDAVLAAADAYVTSPEYLLADARAQVAATIRQAEIDQRRLDGTKAWTKAREQYGAHNVRSIPTVEGDVVIMLGMTAKQIDGANAAAQAARDIRLADDPKAMTIANADYAGVQRDWVLAQCTWPDKDRIRVIAETHPDLWVELHMARNDMARARIEDEGKGFAP